MRGLLIANADDADAGFVGERFRSHGIAFDECHREHPGEWPALDGHDVVVSLGSDWSVDWPEVRHLVAVEEELVRTAHGRGVPTFGICFGSQVTAAALGGRVVRAAAPEVGWCEVDSDDTSIVATGPWLQWHGDVVRLPPGASELARSAVGPQAWIVERSLSVQFHPEATETMLDRWSRGSGARQLEQVGSSREELMAATRANVDAARRHGWRLVDWFLEEVAGGAGRHGTEPRDGPRGNCEGFPGP